ncbi:MAG: HEAT repeat domain-containing protein [Terriglobales bacterium]
MNCDWVKGNITLYVYDELADDSRYELEQHVARCGACAAELETARSFRTTMSEARQLEPTPNLLAASRMRLQEALETAEQNRGWRFLDPVLWLRQMKFSPALAAVLLILGFAGGIGTAWRMVPRAGSAQLLSGGNSASPNEASIAGISEITQVPGSDKVEIKYDTTVPQKAEGSLNDQRIQQLLLFAARNNYNPGVRQNAVDLVSQRPEELRFRESLKASLLYDSNPGVRLKALESLAPYVQQDTSVRDAVLQALQNDTNPGVRAEALRFLQPVRADGAVRVVLEKLASNDRSEFIRQQASHVLASLPEID